MFLAREAAEESALITVTLRKGRVSLAEGREEENQYPSFGDRF
jgi:hypothetical protein